VSRGLGRLSGRFLVLQSDSIRRLDFALARTVEFRPRFRLSRWDRRPRTPRERDFGCRLRPRSLAGADRCRWLETSPRERAREYVRGRAPVLSKALASSPSLGKPFENVRGAVSLRVRRDFVGPPQGSTPKRDAEFSSGAHGIETIENYIPAIPRRVGRTFERLSGRESFVGAASRAIGVSGRSNRHGRRGSVSSQIRTDPEVGRRAGALRSSQPRIRNERRRR
jgi:hypothetical protein